MKKNKRNVVICKYMVFGFFAIGLFFSDCASSKPTREGYNIFNKYGFLFEYPEFFYITEGGLVQGQANKNSGVVTATRTIGEDAELFVITWMEMSKATVGLNHEYFTDSSLKSAIAGMVQTWGNPDQIEYGEIVQSTKEGHYYTYQQINLFLPSYDNVYLDSVAGCWYCDVGQWAFVVSYASSISKSHQNTLMEHNQFLFNLKCH